MSNGCLIVIALIIVSLSGCVESNGLSNSLSEESTRIASWTVESHDKDAVPDYETVFNQSKVVRMDISISAENWQKMLDHMTEIVGPFGQGRMGPVNEGGSSQPGMPQQRGGGDSLAMQACDGSQTGNTCTLNTPMGELEGTCVEMEKGLECQPAGIGMPGGRMERPPGIGEQPDNTEGGAPNRSGGPGRNGADPDMIAETPVYVPCTIAFNGKSWEHVGIRFKGNSTLSRSWSAGIYKLPLRLNFDRFEDEYPPIKNQRFYGFDNLSFYNHSLDASCLKQKIVMDVFNESGVPAPKTCFMNITVNFGDGPVNFGLYTVTEIPEAPMMERLYHSSSGNLYKPSGIGATWRQFLEESFEKKSNEESGDWSDVENAITALLADRSETESWKANLESRFNVNGFLNWLAANTIVDNWDAYGAMSQNYYLYGDPAYQGRFDWIAWDVDNSLGAKMNKSQTFLHEDVGEDWPLIRYLLDDATYFAAYKELLRTNATTSLSADNMLQHINRAYALIAPYVREEQSPYSALSSPDAFETAVEELKTFVATRPQTVLQSLNGAGDAR